MSTTRIAENLSDRIRSQFLAQDDTTQLLVLRDLNLVRLSKRADIDLASGLGGTDFVVE